MICNKPAQKIGIMFSDIHTVRCLIPRHFFYGGYYQFFSFACSLLARLHGSSVMGLLVFVQVLRLSR